MLKETIKKDTIEAMKAKDSVSLEVLRMATAAINAKEKEKFYQDGKEIALSDEEIIGVLSSEIKKRRDAIALYEQGGRPELAEKEKGEIAVLQKYLPAQLSTDEIKKLVAAAIAKTGATEMKDMGKIMADLMPKTKGKAENSEISKIIKELLAK